MRERIALVVMSGVQIVLGEIQIRMVGMVRVSLARQNCQDGILQLVVAQEEVEEASLEGCSLSGWEMGAHIGNEDHPFLVKVAGSGNFQLYWSLCLVRGICGLLRGNPFLTTWTVSCPFLLTYPELICGQLLLVVEGMMFVVVAASLSVVSASAVVMR